MRLLILVWYLQYNKLDRKQSIMVTVEADFDLYSCAQRGQTTDGYYNIYMSAMDIINVNDGRVGMPPAVFKRHVDPMKANLVLKTGKLLVVLTNNKVKALENAVIKAAKKAATGEHLACLLLLLVDDNRFGPLKTKLNILWGNKSTL